MKTFESDKYGTQRKVPFLQPNQNRILDNPTEVQEQLIKWSKAGVIKKLGDINKIKSKVRTSLVLAYNENKNAYRVCFDGGAAKVTQKFEVPCKLDSIYDALNLLEEGDMMCKLDDKSGFLQVKFDSVSQELSHIKWGNLIFKFHGAIFGVPRVPSDFQLINSCVVSFLRSQGIPVTLYLDDRLVIEKKIPKDELKEIEAGTRAPRNTWLTHAFISATGGYISKKKSTFVCKTRLEFLGFIIDTEKKTIEIPTEKWEKLQNNIKAIRSSKEVNFKDLEKMRGVMCSFLVVITNMQLYIRRITESLTYMEENNVRKIKITERLDEDLEIWENIGQGPLRLIRPWTELEPVSVDIISTDASSSNGGWVESDGTERTIPWTPEEAEYHITIKEAIIIYKYLDNNRITSQNKRILFYCDNEAVCKTFHKGAKDKTLNDWIRKIRLLGTYLNATLDIEWVDTKNQKADKASRTLDVREEILTHEVVKAIQREFNIYCNLDLCATFANKKFNRYYSRYKEEKAIGRNAFEYRWVKGDVAYVFPPKAIQGPLFTKLIKEKVPFIGIYHGYHETPPWIGIGGGNISQIVLDTRWLGKHRIQQQTASLVPSKKRHGSYGYYRPTKENYSLIAFAHIPVNN